MFSQKHPHPITLQTDSEPRSGLLSRTCGKESDYLEVKNLKPKPQLNHTRHTRTHQVSSPQFLRFLPLTSLVIPLPHAYEKGYFLLQLLSDFQPPTSETLNLIFSKHSVVQMEARGLEREIIEMVVLNPDKVSDDKNGIRIFQRLVNEQNKTYLYRVFVNITKAPPMVVTAYKTSKTDMYEDPV